MAKKLEEEYEVELNNRVITEDMVMGDESDDTPRYGSDAWSDYIMSLFHEDEMIDGNPLCHGLRRVATQVLGSIVSSKPVEVFPSLDANGPGRATIVYEIIFDWMNSGEFRTFGDVGEVWHGNTDDIYLAHAAATACTKAEARALRKALMVRCTSADEIPKYKDVAAIIKNATASVTPATTGEIASTDKISGPQINFLEGKSRQLDINLLKYINSGSQTYEKIDDISKKTASDMIKKLNGYQNQESPIPDEIKGFDPNWRS